jgi:hypothetical protein
LFTEITVLSVKQSAKYCFSTVYGLSHFKQNPIVNFGNQIDIIAIKKWTKSDRIGHVRLRSKSAGLPPSLKLRTSPDIAGLRPAKSEGNAGRRAKGSKLRPNGHDETWFVRTGLTKEQASVAQSTSYPQPARQQYHMTCKT